MAHPSGSSSVRRDLNQSLVATGVDPCQNPLTTYAVASSLQASEFREVSLGFHQPVSVRRLPSITEHSAVTLSAPSLYQTSVTNREDFCLSQETSISQGILFRGMATGMSQVPGLPARSQIHLRGPWMLVCPEVHLRDLCLLARQGGCAREVWPLVWAHGNLRWPMAWLPLHPRSLCGRCPIHEQASAKGPRFSQGFSAQWTWYESI